MENNIIENYLQDIYSIYRRRGLVDRVIVNNNK